ncbi:hypothetical protein ACIU1J_31600 [Azospirillum doebereinerae]|uniref:hypothetical protein n=1 Tax=Azospirillum doebereinerae TaxID=92933 RepID=UPI001EE61AC9|nr:hypothetical protein [Azospirillum doebereinerae]MCG5238990.1 hypothetical protein [Azospirillum doebereinerae]
MHWIVHIGAPKTGSTAIQRFLFENREPLLACGVRYPDVSLRGYGHHDLAFLLGGGYPVWATPQDRTLAELGAALRDAVRAGGTDTVLLSSENFYLYPEPATLRGLLRSAGMEADDRVSIVCYLRRQDEAHVSWYNQTVKAQGNSAGFEASVRRDHGLWDYAERLKPWQAEFGTSALILRDYTALASGDVRGDFLTAIGLPHAPFALPPVRPNERINRDILDFQRLLNRLPLKVAQKRRYHKHLIALTAATAGDTVFDDTPFLSASQRAALVDSYAQGNASVARIFLDREDLFAPVSVEDNEAPSARRGLTPAKLAFIVRWLIAHRLS